MAAFRELRHDGFFLLFRQPTFDAAIVSISTSVAIPGGADCDWRFQHWTPILHSWSSNRRRGSQDVVPTLVVKGQFVPRSIPERFVSRCEQQSVECVSTVSGAHLLLTCSHRASDKDPHRT